MGESIGIYRKFKVRYYSIINVYGHIRITLKINFMFNNLKTMGVEVKSGGEGGCNDGCCCNGRNSGWGSGWGAVGGALVGGGFGAAAKLRV